MSTPNNTKTDQNISWRCKHTWKTASYNTLWCLLGCSIGDFGTIYFFQVTEYLNPIDHKWIILSLAILCIGQSSFARTQISNVLDLTSDVIRPSSY